MTSANHIFLSVGAAAARSRTFPTSSSSVCADDSTGGGHGARRRHDQRPARSRSRSVLLRTGRRDRHRSATGRPARAAASARPTSSPTTSPSSSSIVPIFPGCSARRRPTPRDASGRGSCSWSFAGSRAWSSGPPATRRCRCSKSSRRPAPQTSCPIWPSRISGRTRRRRASARADLRTVLAIGPGANDVAADLRAPAAARRPSTSRAWCRPTKSAVPRVWGKSTTDTTLRPLVVLGRAGAAPDILLPVYYSWEFRTSDGGDFEELVRRLEPRELPAGGRQAPDGHQPSRLCASAAARDGSARDRHRTGRRAARRRHQTGRLDRRDPRAVPERRWRPSSTRRGRWQRQRRMEIRSSPRRFTVPGTPACTWSRRTATPPSPVPWLNELNLDPRLRAAAAMGTEVVQAEQEALMASAWEQLGEAEAINQRLRQAQLSRAVNERYHTKAFARFTPDAFMRIVAPAQSRFKITPAEPGSQGADALRTTTVAIVRAAGGRFAGGAQAVPPARRVQPAVHARRHVGHAGALHVLQPAGTSLAPSSSTPGKRRLCRDRHRDRRRPGNDRPERAASG